MSCRENFGIVFNNEKRSEILEDVPSKKTKLVPSELSVQNHSENEEPQSNQVLALNLAARFLTARAQLIHQQAVLQQKSPPLGFWPILQPHSAQQNNESQQKLSQMLQIAQFQAYLASAASTLQKTEKDGIE